MPPLLREGEFVTLHLSAIAYLQQDEQPVRGGLMVEPVTRVRQKGQSGRQGRPPTDKLNLQRIVQARNPFSTLSFRCHIKSSLFFFSPRSLLCRLHAPITQSHTPKSFIALQEPVFCFYTYYLSIWIEENARPVSSILRRRTPST
jgi:hypothetical protein